MASPTKQGHQAPGSRSGTVAHKLRTKDPAAVASAKARRPSGPAQKSPQSSTPGRLGVIYNSDNSVGLSDPHYSPSDSTGAIGPTEYIEVVNEQIGVYDRTLKPVGLANTLSAFAGATTDPACAAPAKCDVFDPQIEWDQPAQRWLYAADWQVASSGAAVTQDRLAFGWSQGTSPTATSGWCNFSITTDAGSTLYLYDYPKLGHADGFIIIGANIFDSSDNFQSSTVVAISKPANGSTSCPQPAYTVFGGPGSKLNYADGSGAFTPVPVNLDDSSTTGYIVSAHFPSGPSGATPTASKLGLWQLAPCDASCAVGQVGILAATADITVDPFTFPANVRQPGTTYVLDSLDTRLDQAVGHFDPQANAETVWTQHTIDDPAGSGTSVVRWYEINLATPGVRQVGLISTPGDWSFNAAIAPARDGIAAGIFYNTGSGADTVSIAAQSRTSGDPLGTMSGTLVLGTSAFSDTDFTCSSASSNGVCRWGDYSGATTDPAVDSVVWGTNAYVLTSGNTNSAPAGWSTRNMAIQICPNVPPSNATPQDSGKPWTGGSDAVGVPAGGTDAYFAEGYTGQNFDEYITVENPGNEQPLCVDYILGDGSVIERTYELPANGRYTILVNAEVGPNQNVSAHLHASFPFVAERPMYFNYNGVWTGGDDVMGAQQLGTSYYFAEGYTGSGFNEYLTLLNADPSAPAAVTVTYYLAAGGPIVKTMTLNPHSRATRNVNADVGPNQNVSIQVTSATPILAERPMYFDYKDKWTGGHVVVGTSAPKTSLDLAEGYVANNFDEYLTILNSNGADAHLTITYEVQGGPPVQKFMTVPANSRGTRFVNGDLPAGTSTSVHITSDQPVVVERPMYFDYGSGWDGGHDAVAVDDSQLATTYNFAEGYVASNFDEYLTILNPNTSTGANVQITYFLSGGGTKVVTTTVPAQSRGTVKVNNDFSGAMAQSVQVTSNVPVLVERPMYFSYS